MEEILNVWDHPEELVMELTGGNPQIVSESVTELILGIEDGFMPTMQYWFRDASGQRVQFPITLISNTMFPRQQREGENNADV